MGFTLHKAEQPTTRYKVDKKKKRKIKSTQKIISYMIILINIEKYIGKFPYLIPVIGKCNILKRSETRKIKAELVSSFSSEFVVRPSF